MDGKAYQFKTPFADFLGIWFSFSTSTMILQTPSIPLPCLSNYLLKKSSPSVQTVSRTRPWFPANNPKGPNLATNLGKCYLKDVQLAGFKPGYQFQALPTAVGVCVGRVGVGGECCPVCWSSSLGDCPPNYPKQIIISPKIPCIVKWVSLEKSFYCSMQMKYKSLCTLHLFAL